MKDYQDYIARLHQIPRVLEQATANMRAGLRDRLVPPRYLLEKAAVQAQDIAGKSVKQSVLPTGQPVSCGNFGGRAKSFTGSGIQ